MATRLEAARAGWFFLAYINRRDYIEQFKNDTNFNEEEFDRPAPEIKALFTNPAMPIEEVDKRLLEHRMTGKRGGNEIILMGLHGQPEHIISWFNVGKVTAKVLEPVGGDFEIVLNTYRSRLGEAGLTEDRIDKLVETVKAHHLAISSGSGDTRPFLEVQQLLFSYASDSERDANRPTIDTIMIDKSDRSTTHGNRIEFGDGATIGTFVVAEQIRDSFNVADQASTDKELKSKLKELCQVVSTMIEEIEKDKATEVARDLETFVKEASSQSPRQKWYELSAEGLLNAAKAVGETAKPVIETVKAILLLLA